jgi:hypothetical protein
MISGTKGKIINIATQLSLVGAVDRAPYWVRIEFEEGERWGKLGKYH